MKENESSEINYSIYIISRFKFSVTLLFLFFSSLTALIIFIIISEPNKSIILLLLVLIIGGFIYLNYKTPTNRKPTIFRLDQNSLRINDNCFSLHKIKDFNFRSGGNSFTGFKFKTENSKAYKYFTLNNFSDNNTKMINLISELDKSLNIIYKNKTQHI